MPQQVEAPAAKLLLELNPQDPHGDGENQFLLSSDLHMFTMAPAPLHPPKGTKWINTNVIIIKNEKQDALHKKLYIYTIFLRMLFPYIGQVVGFAVVSEVQRMNSGPSIPNLGQVCYSIYT